MDWLEEETEWYSPKRELTRLKRRAQARWLVVLGAVTVITGAALYKLSRPPTAFTARIILRVAESDMLRDQSPLVGRGLASYLLEAALRTDDLVELLQRNGLYEGEIAVGPTFAANLFRDDLDVAVYRNYFAVGRGYSEGRRTARISIRYRDSDPERAMTVVREVADLMAKTEAENRRRSSMKLAAIGRVAALGAESRLEGLQTRLVESEMAFEAAAEKSADRARLGVEIRGLRVAIERQSDRLSKARRQNQLIELRDAVVGQSLGVDFVIVDERPPTIRGGLRGPLLAMVGMALFFVFFPLVAIAVGAFDVRVHDGADVERLGLPVLGHISEPDPTSPPRRVKARD